MTIFWSTENSFTSLDKEERQKNWSLFITLILRNSKSISYSCSNNSNGLDEDSKIVPMNEKCISILATLLLIHIKWPILPLALKKSSPSKKWERKKKKHQKTPLFQKHIKTHSLARSFVLLALRVYHHKCISLISISFELLFIWVNTCRHCTVTLLCTQHEPTLFEIQKLLSPFEIQTH